MSCRSPWTRTSRKNDMRYRNVIPAAFIDRPNRFIAHVEIGGRRETVHVKNTGRCRELLLPGAEVFLAGAENPERKTAWDLIAVRKSGGLLVNIDSQAGDEKFLMEVKGCTLERDGIGYFPDAPTERGAKHLRELANAAGYTPVLLFVIQMDGIMEVRGNRETDPAFCEALEHAEKAGVKIRFLPCHVEPDSLTFAR